MPNLIQEYSKKVINAIGVKVAPQWWKGYSELQYWKDKKQQEQVFSNDHYQHFYTTHFGISPDFYKDKVIMDIGCGPRGSLEWADGVNRRIGLDPLADEYLKLGASEHKMEYIAAPSENIPLENASCDAIFSFNSLDHVVDVNKTIAEITRLVKPGGIFLLLVEINYPPTNCEPHELHARELLDDFAPAFTFEPPTVYKQVKQGMYQSILENTTVENPLDFTEPAYLSVKFTRQPDIN